MNTYKIQRYQYSSSVSVFFEVKAENVKFEEGRVNFYLKDRLIGSYPSTSTAIIEIKYKNRKNE